MGKKKEKEDKSDENYINIGTSARSTNVSNYRIARNQSSVKSKNTDSTQKELKDDTIKKYIGINVQDLMELKKQLELGGQPKSIDTIISEKSKNIASTIKSFIKDASKEEVFFKEETKVVYRFYDERHGGLQSLAQYKGSNNDLNSLSIEDREKVINNHMNRNVKETQIGKEVYYSPLLSTTENLTDFLGTSFNASGTIARGDFNLRYNVLHNATTVAAISVPSIYCHRAKPRKKGVLSSIKANANSEKLDQMGNISISEKEVCVDTSKFNMSDSKRIEVKNPFKGHMNVDLNELLKSRTANMKEEAKFHTYIPSSAPTLTEIKDIVSDTKQLISILNYDVSQQQSVSRDRPVIDPRYADYAKEAASDFQKVLDYSGVGSREKILKSDPIEQGQVKRLIQLQDINDLIELLELKESLAQSVLQYEPINNKSAEISKLMTEQVQEIKRDIRIPIHQKTEESVSILVKKEEPINIHINAKIRESVDSIKEDFEAWKVSSDSRISVSPASSRKSYRPQGQGSQRSF